ncbi:hypothetical protein SmJEL517_g04498 [Synchytrium microbalum]|uniref:LysM domain-containing protein n=1 Tax=Synchytrium microbalum TaxID=1806994 RepID=A0A507C447_9FUNG|nr:uncharacterized protein SmJEL517_g04498 [Synchytrium microbalum]TPX32345.1 hypothetical protein SmJEL517_g04498 [Synchytrium microbalum]
MNLATLLLSFVSFSITSNALAVVDNTVQLSSYPQYKDCKAVYIVQANEACFDVAVKFNHQGPDPAANLMQLNSELFGTSLDCNNLNVGIVVCVDCEGKPYCPYHVANDCTKVHKCEKGDTLNTLASIYGVSNKSDFAQFNLGLQVEINVYPEHQVCVIPPTKPPPYTPQYGKVPDGACARTHVLQNGDNCYDLAVNNNMQGPDPAARLISINQRILGMNFNCAALPVGATVCVDCMRIGVAASDCPYHLSQTCSKIHTVAEGETLTTIAQANGMADAKGLLPLNPGLDLDAFIYAANTVCTQGTPNMNPPNQNPPPSPNNNPTPQTPNTRPSPVVNAPNPNYVPGPQPTGPPLGACPHTYVVKQGGEKCFDIGVNFNQQGPDPAQKLVSMNQRLLGVTLNCQNQNVLQAGVTICVDCTNTGGATDCPYHLSQGCTKVYTIVAGDELNKIAMMNGLRNGSDLLPLNPGLNLDLVIFPGNHVCVVNPAFAMGPAANNNQPKPVSSGIPVGAVGVPAAPARGDCPKTYVVNQDPAAKILSLNQRLLNVSLNCGAPLQAGTTVCVGCLNNVGTTDCPFMMSATCTSVHMVATGETFNSIAMANGFTNGASLVALNPGIDINSPLVAGNKVCVKASGAPGNGVGLGGGTMPYPNLPPI